jgi:hypothetical protein
MSSTPRRSAKGKTTPFVLGRRAFARISAVERIHLTSEMNADFRSFDDSNLSASERRAEIARKYGKRR